MQDILSPLAARDPRLPEDEDLQAEDVWGIAPCFLLPGMRGGSSRLRKLFHLEVYIDIFLIGFWHVTVIFKAAGNYLRA